MNHELTLHLELLEQAVWGFRFRVSARNASQTKLFLPRPDIVSLQFVERATMEAAEWGTRMLVSADLTTSVLPPGGALDFEWRVRPCSVACVDESDWDYSRWCIQLVAGNYLVWCQYCVDETYFDGDSHVRLPDLLRAAEEEGAVLWQGQVLSNRLQVAYGEPDA